MCWVEVSKEDPRAVALADRAKWGEPPKDGIITYVGKHLKGGTFHAAGFKKVGLSRKRGLPLLQLSRDRMPPPLQPADVSLFEHEMLI